MSNDILEVVQRFIRATGRKDLVQDYHNGDFDDNGVFTFINDGIKDLDRRIALEVSRVEGYEGALVTDSSCAIIPDYKQISTVYYKGVNGITFTELKPLTLNEAVRKYLCPLDEVESGDPVYYVPYTDTLPAAVLNFADTLNTFEWFGATSSHDSAAVTLWREFCSCIVEFSLIDSDDNGLVSEADLTTYGISAGFGMSVLFSSVDLDGDGYITRNDLILYLRNNSPSLPLEHGWATTDIYDAPVHEYGADILESGISYLHSITDRTYDMGIYAELDPVYGMNAQCKVVLEVANDTNVHGYLYITCVEATLAFNASNYALQTSVTSVYAIGVPADTVGTYTIILPDKKAPFLLIRAGNVDLTLNSLEVIPIASSASAEVGAVHVLPQVADGTIITTGFPATPSVTSLTDTNYWTHSKRIAVLSLAAQYHHELTQAQTGRAVQLDTTIDKLVRDLINDDIFNNGPIEDSIIIRG